MSLWASLIENSKIVSGNENVALILWVSRFVDATVTLLDAIFLMERMGAVQVKKVISRLGKIRFFLNRVIAPHTEFSFDNTVSIVDIFQIYPCDCRYGCIFIFKKDYLTLYD